MKRPVVEVILSHQAQHRRNVLLYGVGGIFGVLVITTGVLAYCGFRTQDSPIAVSTPTPSPTAIASTPTPTPTLVPALLDGSMVEPGQQNIHPLAVMIENHPDARPQSGLGEASLVYEAIAEGGITRFEAIFRDPSKAVKVGPIRSARPYFVDFATEINAFYAHVGGSVDALQQIKSTGVLDLDQSTVGSPTFARDFSRGVALEHTMYSSTDKLWNYATTTRHWSTTQDYTPWQFQDDVDASKRPSSETIKVSVSDPQYAVEWQYDPTSNSYLRFMAGSAHIDSDTGKQITTKNIVLQAVQSSAYTESYGDITKQVNDVQTSGSGTATIFQNGTSSKGTWKKTSTGRTQYFDSAGKEISFVRGNTWVELTYSDSTVSY